MNPSKTDRRFFIVRVSELIRDRVIEKVLVPSGTEAKDVLCIRLLPETGSSAVDPNNDKGIDQGSQSTLNTLFEPCAEYLVL